MSSYLAHKRKGFQGSAPSAFDGFGNRSRSFDGVDDYVTIPDNPSLPTGAQTISAWVKTENVGDYADIVSHWDNAGEAGFVILKLQDNQIAFYITNTGSTAGNGARFTQTGSGNTINVGSWYHVSCVFDPSTSMKIYINGILTSTNSNSIHSSIYDSGNDLFIGERADIANRNWHGNIADVRIYDTDLTASQISDIYNGTNITTNLVGHWLTDADNLLDAAGSNNGTNYGSKYSYDNPSPPVEFGSASRNFNGSSDYVDLGDVLNTVLTGSTPTWTISTWLKTDSLDDGMFISKLNADTNDRQLFFRVLSTGEVSGIVYEGGTSNSIRYGRQTSTSGSITANTWHHVAISWDYTATGSYLRIWIDGAEATTLTDYFSNGASNGSIFSGNANLIFGTSDGTPITHWGGKIADMRIYDTDLTASQVSDLYAGTDVQTNLVGHWLTDNDDVEDKAGINDGTNFGSTYSYDNPPMDLIPSRQASRSFNGSSDYIDLGNNYGSSVFTASAWIKRDTIIPTAVGIVGKWKTANDKSWLIYSGAEHKCIIRQSNDTTIICTDPTNAVANQWYHLAATADGSNLKLYVDGSLVDTKSYDGTMSANSLSTDIGTFRQSDGSFFFDGKIADVRIYNTHLTASQILAIYNGTTDRTNLIGQWLTNSDDVVDHAGTNDGTNNGSTYSTDSPS